MPGVVAPSPQSMVAVNEDAVSVEIVSLKLAISVLVAIATFSSAAVRSTWPLFSIGGSPSSLLTRRSSSQPIRRISREWAYDLTARPSRVNRVGICGSRGGKIRFRGRSLVGRVGLFLDDGGVGRRVDAPLECRSLVVEPVDGARQFDEAFPEVAATLQGAQLIFDVP